MTAAGHLWYAIGMNKEEIYNIYLQECKKSAESVSELLQDNEWFDGLWNLNKSFRLSFIPALKYDCSFRSFCYEFRNIYHALTDDGDYSLVWSEFHSKLFIIPIHWSDMSKDNLNDLVERHFFSEPSTDYIVKTLEEDDLEFIKKISSIHEELDKLLDDETSRGHKKFTEYKNQIKKCVGEYFIDKKIYKI